MSCNLFFIFILKKFKKNSKEKKDKKEKKGAKFTLPPEVSEVFQFKSQSLKIGSLPP
jgi:hypothetical protein